MAFKVEFKSNIIYIQIWYHYNIIYFLIMLLLHNLLILLNNLLNNLLKCSEVVVILKFFFFAKRWISNGVLINGFQTIYYCATLFTFYKPSTLSLSFLKTICRHSWIMSSVILTICSQRMNGINFKNMKVITWTQLLWKLWIIETKLIAVNFWNF